MGILARLFGRKDKPINASHEPSIEQTNIVSLIQALGDEDADVRIDAIEKLTQIGRPAVDSLIKALEDKSNDSRRFSAADALWKIKDPKALDTLITALHDPSHYVRIEAAIALGNMKDPRAVKPLVKALEDPDEVVIQYAADALGQIRDSGAVEGLFKALSRRPRLYNLYEALAKIGAPSIRPFAVKLRDSDEEVRMWAAYQLKNIAGDFPGIIKDADVIHGLVEGLKDTSPHVRSEAVRTLGHIRDPETVDAIRKLLNDPDEDVREGAKLALEEIRGY